MRSAFVHKLLTSSFPISSVQKCLEACWSQLQGLVQGMWVISPDLAREAGAEAMYIGISSEGS